MILSFHYLCLPRVWRPVLCQVLQVHRPLSSLPRSLQAERLVALRTQLSDAYEHFTSVGESTEAAYLEAEPADRLPRLAFRLK
jgi:hypothetical protein